MFKDKTLLITGGTGSFGNTVLKHFLHTDIGEIRIFELYQQMLEEAVAEVKGVDEIQDTGWSPQISVGTPVMIPDGYVPDLHLRMALYRDRKSVV